jgi:hypothetical protein
VLTAIPRYGRRHGTVIRLTLLAVIASAPAMAGDDDRDRAINDNPRAFLPVPATTEPVSPVLATPGPRSEGRTYGALAPTAPPRPYSIETGPAAAVPTPVSLEPPPPPGRPIAGLVPVPRPRPASAPARIVSIPPAPVVAAAMAAPPDAGDRTATDSGAATESDRTPPRIGVWPVARPQATLAALTPPDQAAAGNRQPDVSGSAKIVWNAEDSCLPPRLKQVLVDVAERFGPIVVWSTNRPPTRNRQAGGARQSYHLDCRAIDFRPVNGGNSRIIAYLRTRIEIGGWNIYRNGLIHIDDGPRRTW